MNGMRASHPENARARPHPAVTPRLVEEEEQPDHEQRDHER
jgi:hypothetical protein